MRTKRVTTPTRRVPLAPGWSLLILRVTIGVVFVAHGFDKFFGIGLGNAAGLMRAIGTPLPFVSAVLVALTEVTAGLALIVGLYARLAALLLGIIAFVATLSVHLPQGFFVDRGGLEFTLVLSAATLALFLSGPGRLAVRHIDWRRLRQRRAQRRAAKHAGPPTPTVHPPITPPTKPDVPPQDPRDIG